MPPEDLTNRPLNGRPPQFQPRQPGNLPPVAPRRAEVPISRDTPPPAAPSTPTTVETVPTPVEDAPVPSEPLPTPTPPTTPNPSAPATTLDFTPPAPAKKRRSILPIVLIIVGVLLIGGLVFGVFHTISARNNPDTIFKQALEYNLSTQKLQSETIDGDVSSKVSYDYTNPVNPIISTDSTIQFSGADFQVAGYGSAQNNYISYTKIPENIPSALASNVQNSWIQLRTNGIEATGVNPTLAKLADPRSQVFGPIIFANLPDKTRTQIVDFLLAHKVYAYDKKKVSHQTVAGSKVIAYPVTLDTGFLKIANQSVAFNEKFSPADIKTATDSLDSYKGATATFYIDAGTHRLKQVSISKAGNPVTTTYTNSQTSLPNEPQTKLSWQSFAPLQTQLEAQAAAHPATKP